MLCQKHPFSCVHALQLVPAHVGPGAADASIRADAVGEAEAGGDAEIDVAFEVLDPNNKVLVRADAEAAVVAAVNQIRSPPITGVEWPSPSSATRHAMFLPDSPSHSRGTRAASAAGTMPSPVGPFRAGQKSGLVAGWALERADRRTRTAAVGASGRIMSVKLTVRRGNSFASEKNLHGAGRTAVSSPA